jgi:hypothetical protein
MTKSPLNRASALVAAALVVFGLAQSHGQGTMTVTFDNPPLPPNTASLISSYSESGINFWYPVPPGPVGLVLVGAGNAGGSPNNGTTHLETFAGSYVAFAPTSVTPFSLRSFDATESYSITPRPETLHVVGYKFDSTSVWTDLTTDGGRQFQTYTLDSRFANLFSVVITPSSWSGFALDNVVVGIPEPSVGGLLLLAAASAFGRSWVKRRRL